MKIPVLLPNIFDHPFTYESDKKVEVGRYVLVPFGKNDAVGLSLIHISEPTRPY